VGTSLLHQCAAGDRERPGRAASCRFVEHHYIVAVPIENHLTASSFGRFLQRNIGAGRARATRRKQWREKGGLDVVHSVVANGRRAWKGVIITSNLAV
jgi:hypothetical protein